VAQHLTFLCSYVDFQLTCAQIALDLKSKIGALGVVLILLCLQDAAKTKKTTREEGTEFLEFLVEEFGEDSEEVRNFRMGVDQLLDLYKEDFHELSKGTFY
jgi:hypothetical protein